MRHVSPRPAEITLALVAATLAVGQPAWAQPAWAQPAWAQPAAPAAAATAPVNPADDEAYNEVEELVVTAGAGTPRGSVLGDIPPELVLGPRDIRATGVSSVAELLQYLEPQTASGRGRGGGRPVVLVNGARISSFAEIRDLPTEAIQRVEVLPEEVALKYGYRADQRVVNFVLRRRFRALTAEVSAGGPTAGGRSSHQAGANLLRIQRDDRLQLDIKATRATSLLESERDILRDPAQRPFSAAGVVVGQPFSPTRELDPGLSALAGRPVSASALPPGLGRAPSLADFAAAGGPGPTGDGDFRTLLPYAGNVALNAVLTRTLGEGVSATLNGTLDIGESESLLGLGATSLAVPAGGPFSPFARPVEVLRHDAGQQALSRTTDSVDMHLGTAVNGALKGWRWSFTGNADRGSVRSLTETGQSLAALQAAVLARDPAVNPFAPIPAALTIYREPDQSKSVVTSADAEGVANGTLFDLPAGGLSATFKVGGETRRLDSQSRRGGVARSTDLPRLIGRAQASFDLPLASRRREVLSPLGDLSANLNVAVDQLSDFGTLTTVGFGANWSPIEAVRALASFTEEDGAPTIAQLGDPETVTPGVRVFDFARGETVDANRITGGNPGLSADNRRVVKLGVTVKPFDETDLTFRADYTKARTLGVIASFPTATAEIEAAFPERFLRDASGRLIQIDSRPVNFARQDREELRYGFNYSRRLGPQRPPGAGPGGGGPEGGGLGGERREFRQAARAAPGATSPTGAAAAAPQPGQAPASGAPAVAPETRGPGGFRGGGGPRGGPGGFGGFGGGGPGGFGGGGQLQLTVFHTVHLQEDILIRPGVPVLDLLNGSAVGNGGGQPRHEIDVQAGATRNGLGARLTAKWQSGTEVRGAAARGGEDLIFSDLTTVGLRLFADLGQRPMARPHTWLRGARATLSVDNLFDQRRDVRTASGVIPISYQPDLLDPVGRTVRVSFRKLFF